MWIEALIGEMHKPSKPSLLLFLREETVEEISGGEVWESKKLFI